MLIVFPNAVNTFFSYNYKLQIKSTDKLLEETASVQLIKMVLQATEKVSLRWLELLITAPFDSLIQPRA